ncbi:hypothetical protein MMC25_007437 [Agyrium rufum]|nr:hypothetical protein [Agyrium rufum]
MHHSLGNGRFQMYHEMAKHITIATTVLNDAKTASSEIDRVLEAMMIQHRPVYIGLAVDVGPQKISSLGLTNPLQLTVPSNNSVIEGNLVKQITETVATAKKAIIIVDGGKTVVFVVFFDVATCASRRIASWRAWPKIKAGVVPAGAEGDPNLVRLWIEGIA